MQNLRGNSLPPTPHRVPEEKPDHYLFWFLLTVIGVVVISVMIAMVSWFVGDSVYRSFGVSGVVTLIVLSIIIGLAFIWRKGW